MAPRTLKNNYFSELSFFIPSAVKIQHFYLWQLDFKGSALECLTSPHKWRLRKSDSRKWLQIEDWWAENKKKNYVKPEKETVPWHGSKTKRTHTTVTMWTRRSHEEKHIVLTNFAPTFDLSQWGLNLDDISTYISTSSSSSFNSPSLLR